MRPTEHSSSSEGFTLIELAIGLVIIGLIIGGIMGGQAMIRGSELRSIITEKKNFEAAIGLFAGKYRGLPGDLVDATSYWGSAHSVHATCKSTASATKATCNGNGDGITAHCSSSAPQAYEMFLIWKHLANAGMISGTYSGIHGPGSLNDSIAGVNVPKPRYPAGGWEISHMDTGDATCNAGYQPTAVTRDRNVLIFGAKRLNNQYEGPLLSAYDAKDIDEKMDDGRPRSGKAHNIPGHSVLCASGADYRIANKGTNCSFVFLLE